MTMLANAIRKQTRPARGTRLRVARIDARNPFTRAPARAAERLRTRRRSGPGPRRAASRRRTRCSCRGRTGGVSVGSSSHHDSLPGRRKMTWISPACGTPCTRSDVAPAVDGEPPSTISGECTTRTQRVPATAGPCGWLSGTVSSPSCWPAGSVPREMTAPLRAQEAHGHFRHRRTVCPGEQLHAARIAWEDHPGLAELLIALQRGDEGRRLHVIGARDPRSAAGHVDEQSQQHSEEPDGEDHSHAHVSDGAAREC